ncbi:MAG: mono/diheme cytochrome c family protein, partial [Myxococcota bacterium]
SLTEPTIRGGVAPFTVSNTAPAAGYPVGETNVEWTIVDGGGDRAVVVQTITIEDTQAPTLLAPPNLIANATGTLTAVFLGFASATDLVSGTVTVTNNAPVSFPVGTRTVTWYATDGVGNRATATQRVTVNEVSAGALVISPPPAIVREARGVRSFIGIGNATASGGQAPLVITNDASTSGYAVGDYLVTWTVRDAGNQTSIATQQVRIIDTTAPSINAPADVTVTALGEHTPVSLGTPAATDLADPSLVITNDAPAAGFRLGVTTVRWTARDASGNSTVDTQQVTVNPGAIVLAAPSARAAEATGQRTNVSIGQATPSGGTPPYAIENDAPATGYTLGQHTVTWTVRDANNATSNATQTVTISDTTPPLLSAPSNRTVESETAPVDVALGSATAADLSGSAVTITNDASGTSFGFGTTEIVWTATDSSGNASNSSQYITVAEVGSVVGDAVAGEEAYAATCEGCHGSDIGLNVSGIQNGATFAGIDNALLNVNAMSSLSYLRSDTQTIADIAAFIAAYEEPAPPTSSTCQVDEDPMQAVALQRLSKVQYANTIRDLLARQLSSATAASIYSGLADEMTGIPDDQATQGFANFDQSVTASHVEGFLDVAWALAGEVTASDSLLVDFVGESCATNSYDAGCRERFIESFGSIAMRHPLSNDEIDFYAATTDYRALITTMLMAPGFLSIEQYRGDEDVDNSELTVLSNYELASKLAYHFWQTMPDAQLTASAASGEIATDFEAVVERVFTDSRTRAGMPEFFSGWLRMSEIPEFDTARPERVSFLTEGYGNGTDLPANLDLVVYRQAAIDEVLAFADYTTFVDDGTLEDLFTSTHSFATDAALARAYGVSTWAGGNATPIPFTEAQPRSGLLGRAALQMYGDFASHPILKGARIRTELLCDELAAPADVAAPAEAVIHPNYSARELTQAITEISGTPCAGCHTNHINPVGFPSESFDALGRHRSEEVLYDEAGDERYRAAVNTYTVPQIDLDAPDAVQNVVELGELMAGNPKTSECFVRNYYRFSQRRMEVDSTDSCELDALENALHADGLQGMLKAAALLPEFKLRVLAD